MRTFPAVHIEGGLLGPDTLDALLTGDLPGQKAKDFGLDGHRGLTEEIAATFAEARTLWGVFQGRLARLGEADPATTLTRDAWLIPFLTLLGYELRYNPRAYELDGLTFAISHRAGEAEDAPPVHLVGARQRLGSPAPTGRPRLSPHALVQEYLNRSEALWGLTSNGLTLRLLRDSTFVRRQAYVEFDLAAIFDQQLFLDFAVLYRLLHRSRLPTGARDAARCLLECYYAEAVQQGGRVREGLRVGVKDCLTALGSGFLAHPESAELRRRVTAPADLYRQLLRLVYRFLFLLVSEERGLISDDILYREHYGVSRLRRLVDERAAYTDHDDLWQSLRVLWRVLADEQLARTLHVAPLNGELFAPLDLDSATITNRDLLTAFWHLAYYRDPDTSAVRRVNYAALDTEELGSVYESLLELHPAICGHGFRLDENKQGAERKSTGSYYTPPDLVHELIQSALVPVMEERLKAAKTQEDKERALLDLRVLDPACGSGHFLLAAARRLGKELACVRTGEEEPGPEAVREATRAVIGHCLYGVDKNPLAVELCKVALWLEGHAAGKPLTFLDHRIRCGDALVGVFDLRVLADGIPDAAYERTDQAEKAAARGPRARNRQERDGQLPLPLDATLDEGLLNTAIRWEEVEGIADDSPAAVAEKARRYQEARQQVERERLACDLWTAAFFWDPREPHMPTTATVRRCLENPATVSGQVAGAARALAERLRFFHWPLEFPDVFARGGFDVVLGNPPWERIKLQEEEFFASRDPAIARAPNKAARQRLLAALPRRDPALAQEFAQAKHDAEAQSGFVRGSGRFPLCGRGDVNTYSLFAELMRALLARHGRAGLIVPSGIATDDTTKHFFQDLMGHRSLVSLYDFENREGLFPAVDSRVKFCLLTLTGGGRPAAEAEFAFFLHRAEQLREAARRFTLTAADMALLNPNTRTCPIFRTTRDAELTKHIYRRVPVLVRDGVPDGNPWGVKFSAMFHMANDSHLFRTREQLEGEGWRLLGNVFVRGEGLSPDPPLERYLPLYEAKLIHQFDHRWATYDNADTRDLTPAEKANPACLPLPRYWVPEREVEARLAGRWRHGWLLGWRDITNSTNERTVIAGIIPRVGVGHKFPLFVLDSQHEAPLLALYANLNSFVLDYVARQKIGGTSLTYFYLKQFPVLPPEAYQVPCPWWPEVTLHEWLAARVLELTYTAWDLAPFARDLGYRGPPFRWDGERRFLLRCELDAAFFHLYLGSAQEWEREASPELKALFPTPRDAVAYILDTFPIVRRKDELAHGEYRTQRVILEIYDAMAHALAGGPPYQTHLDPPPADPSRSGKR